ncbi:hypothetical protein SAMN02745166_03491 [Prosthecobacter debontii]|uniref:Uncharacterized protein n=1 Tax=Prosthecobacter debontii TaxID=48467 RepID=A0A1T4YKU4_9BACT|nr:hypothetical protein [Prosthecobacter debontii]SKB01875.1 hypothetical protein SAMN02745166_03491 [Prosthecobacter debontii]
MSTKIDEILNQRRTQEKPEEPTGEKFFSALLGEGMYENFLELQFRNGLQTCFSYSDLTWFSHDPESGCLDLEFGGFLITVKGRGLQPLFNSIKSKRVAWVKEANHDLQDHAGNECFIEEIMIQPPQGFTGEPTEASDA